MNQLRWWLLVLFAVSVLFAGGQKVPDPASTPLRIEIPAGSDNETYRVIPCSESGAVLFYQSVEVDENQRVKWYFTLYDENLQQVWSKGVPLLKGMIFRDSKYNSDTLCLFFQTDPKNKETGSKFQIVRSILPSGNFIINSGGLPDGAELAFFKESHEKVYAALNIRNDVAQLMVVDLPTGIINMTPMGAGGQTTFLALDVDTETGHVRTLMQKSISKRLNDNFLIIVDQKGSILSESPVSTMSTERQLTSAFFSEAGGGNKLVSGTYVTVDALLSDQEKFPVKKVTGFFTSLFNAEGQQTLFFNNFLELSSIKSILSERDLIALRKKTMKKSQANEETSGDFYAIVHESQVYGNQVIVVAELFYPQYHTETFSDYDYYGRPITNTYSVFDGFRFTSAVAAGFDFKGNLLWDNYLEFRNLITGNLSQKAVLFPSGDDFILAYLSDGKVASKVFRGQKTVEKTDYAEIMLLSPTDKLIRESKGSLLPWYGNYFICCGFQELKDIAVGNNAKRLVFYCTKILAE